MGYRLRGVGKSYGGLSVLEGIDLEMAEGDMAVVLGPSGCGKTSLLKIVAGLDRDHGGERSGFEGCSFSFAFQEPRLLPWSSVLENLRFALAGSRLGVAEATERIRELLALAGLGGREDSRPGELSGGMRQRVSLVRAFAYPATFMLLDEAFQSVDVGLRRELMSVFLELRRVESRTAILVTHQPDEALWLADRVVILSSRPGRIIDDFPIAMAREDRRPGSPAIAALEERIYAGLLR